MISTPALYAVEDCSSRRAELECLCLSEPLMDRNVVISTCLVFPSGDRLVHYAEILPVRALTTWNLFIVKIKPIKVVFSSICHKSKVVSSYNNIFMATKHSCGTVGLISSFHNNISSAVTQSCWSSSCRWFELGVPPENEITNIVLIFLLPIWYLVPMDQVSEYLMSH